MTLRRIIVAAVLVLGGAVGQAWVDGPDAEPYCPTEDSCTADYRDARWHVSEDR